MWEFSIKRNGENLTIDFGKVDGPAVRELQSAMKMEIASGARSFTFDLSNMDFLDCRRIGLLVAAGNSIHLSQGTMSLINVPQEIMKVLQTLRLTERLHAAPHGKAAFDGRK